MKTYHVHFSFYSEENGNFDEACYSVSAENLFEARRMAWALRDTDDDARFQSCVKQCGVTWDASPLDLQDYFNAQAAYANYRIRYIENVTIPNTAIQNNNDEAKRAESERSYFFGSLEAVFQIARDIGKPLGMAPPNAYEEIEYTWRLVGKLDEMGRHDAAEVLAKRIEKAQKWDVGAIHDLRSLFIHSSIHLPGDYINFSQFYGRDGVFPERADIDEREYPYIDRWRGAPFINRISVLPPFDGRHVIKGSADAMPYNFKPLVLRKDELDIDHPETLLWMPCEDDNNIAFDYERPFPVENLITGERSELKRGNFYGVLRPEFYDNIDFEALKNEYAAQNTQKVDWWDEPDGEDEDDWEQGDD